MTGDLRQSLARVMDDFAVEDEPPAQKGTENSDEQDDGYANAEDPKTNQKLKLIEAQATALIQQNQRLSQMHKLRQNVAVFIFVIIFVWLVCVMALVFFGSYDVTYLKGSCVSYEYHTWLQKLVAVPEGCAVLKSGNFLNLSESIVIALITTTTANVLGLSYIVAKWLFPKPQGDTSDITPIK
jgi:hypothetical protein